MKATLLLVVFVLLGLALLVGEPAAVAAGLTAATGHAAQTPEPAWMLLSGATLLGLASAVRRFVP
jgi:hypothetical protein